VLNIEDTISHCERPAPWGHQRESARRYPCVWDGAPWKSRSRAYHRPGLMKRRWRHRRRRRRRRRHPSGHRVDAPRERAPGFGAALDGYGRGFGVHGV